MTAFTESVVEDAALAWLEALGYQVLHGPAIAVGEQAAERSDPNCRDVILERRLRQALVQLNTYQAQIPSFFSPNVALIISDGVQARIGTLGAGKEWFKPWRTIGGHEDAPSRLTELQVILEGVFEKRRFLDLVRHFFVFEDEGHGKLAKKMAGYHQFHRSTWLSRKRYVLLGVRQSIMRQMSS